MTHTLYRDSHTLLIPNRAMAYDPVEKSATFTLDVSYFEQTGDGAVHTTVGDLLKWDENFYTAQVGGKPFLVELQTPGTLNNGKTLDYAKGPVRRILSRPAHGSPRRFVGRLPCRTAALSRTAFFRCVPMQSLGL